jgi:hypothetical protein
MGDGQMKQQLSIIMGVLFVFYSVNTRPQENQDKKQKPPASAKDKIKPLVPKPETSDPATANTKNEPDGSVKTKKTDLETDGSTGLVRDTSSKQASPSENQHFIKGELSSFIGSSKLVTANNRIGVRLGWQALDLVHYFTINPEVDLRFEHLNIGFGAPIALKMFDGTFEETTDWSAGFDDMGQFRKEDWDELSEFARFIRYLTWGRKEDNIYVSLSQVGANTIGHGAIVRRYSINIDPDSTRVSGQLDMYNDYGGFELTVNNIMEWDLFGGIAFIKPLSLFSENPMARSLSLGFTYVVDRHAPVLLTTQASVNSTPSKPFFVLGSPRPDVHSAAFLQALGVDAEFKAIKTERVDIKPFVDYSWLIPSAPDGTSVTPVGGSGLTLGVLGRFNFGSHPVHAMRMVAEFRSFSAHYIPGYFDTFYEVQKFIVKQNYLEHAAAHCPGPLAFEEQRPCLPATKFQDMFVDRQGDRHTGFYLEYNYAIVEKLSLTLSLEGSDAPSGNNFLAHIEVPALGWLQFFASYHQRSMISLSDLFSGDGTDKIVFAAARLRLLPIVFINFRYHHTLQFRKGTADLNGDGMENTYQYYLPLSGYMADIEFGWEF